MKLMYPRIIIYTIIASIIILFVWRRKSKFKKGVMVANTKYVKNTTYYKNLIFRYRFYNILIKVLCVCLLILTAVFSSRIYQTDEYKEEISNRDIMLCMDVSNSVYDLDAEVIDTFTKIVSRLHDERFGISVFDNSPINILPLTTDYNYALSVLKELKEAFSSNKGRDYAKIRSLFMGAYSGEGSSLIGDGLAYCASTFKKDDDRTKIVILSTDNELSGNQIISVLEAANYSKMNNVKVYPIGTKTIQDKNRQELMEVANITGGKYYDFSKLSIDNIANDIEKLNSTVMVKDSYVVNKDFPMIIFPYIFFLIPILFILDWRVRI